MKNFRTFRNYSVLFALLMVSLLGSVAFAQVVVLPASSKLPGTVPAGEAEGFCAQFSKGRSGVSLNSLAVNLALLDDTAAPTHRHDPDLTFFAILPIVNLHDAANANTTREVGHDQLLPWSNPSADVSAGICESHGGGPGVSDGERIGVRLQGNLHVRQAGMKTFVIRSDDGYRVTIGGVDVSEHNGARAAQVDSVRVNFVEAGIYPIEVLYYENTGAAVLEMFMADREITFTHASSASAVAAATPADGVDLRNSGIPAMPAAFRLLSYEDVGLPSWEPAFKPVGYTNCRDLVGEPSDICVIDDPAMTCGNGAIDALPGDLVEGCDDGNTTAGDGCSATCGVEPGWTCVGQPSRCFPDEDGDGIADDVDNCPTIANPDQLDSNSSGFGDVCDVMITGPVDGVTLGTEDVVVSGTTTPNTVVTVLLDGVPVGTVTSNASGVWSYTVVGLDEGQHDVDVTAEVEGQTVSDTVSFTVNAENFIAITTPADGATLDTPTPSIVGTTVPGATVTVIVDGIEVGTVTADGSGNWRFDIVGVLADGSYTVQVETTNAGGVLATDTATFVIDTTPDDAPLVVTSPADGDVTGSVPVVTGTGEPGTEITVSVDDVQVGTVVVDADGNWSFAVPDALDDGAHTITVEADVDGDPIEITIDITVDGSVVPVYELAITSPVDGDVTGGQPTITGTAEPNSEITISVDGEPVGNVVTDGDGNWSYALPDALDDGAHTIHAETEIDDVPVEVTVDITVDRDVHPDPLLVITSPQDGDKLKTPTPIITGTTEPGVSVTVSMDGVVVGTVVADEDGNWSLAITDALADAMHTVRAEAEINGEIVETSVTFEVKRPGTGVSTIEIISPTMGEVVTTSTPTVTGKAPAGATVTIVVDDVVVGTVVADADGNWSFKIPAPIADGEHLIDAQIEIDGVSSEASVQFKVKHSGPDLVVKKPTTGDSIIGDGPVEVTGTASPGSTIDIYVDGELVTSTEADGDGNWSAEIPGMEPGNVEISVVARDGDGGETTVTVYVDIVDFIPGIGEPEGVLTGGGMLCSAAPGGMGGGSGLAGILAFLLTGTALHRRRRQRA